MECTLRGIFQEHFEAYAARHRLPAYVHRAAYWISRCRTAELGGHLRRCPQGHSARAVVELCAPSSDLHDPARAERAVVLEPRADGQAPLWRGARDAHGTAWRCALSGCEARVARGAAHLGPVAVAASAPARARRRRRIGRTRRLGQAAAQPLSARARPDDVIPGEVPRRAAPLDRGPGPAPAARSEPRALRFAAQPARTQEVERAHPRPLRPRPRRGRVPREVSQGRTAEELATPARRGRARALSLPAAPRRERRRGRVRAARSHSPGVPRAPPRAPAPPRRGNRARV